MDTLIWQGFLPRVHAAKIEPLDAYRDYLLTYVERDVRQIQHIKDLGLFRLKSKLARPLTRLF